MARWIKFNSPFPCKKDTFTNASVSAIDHFGFAMYDKIGTGKSRFGQFYYAEQGENHLKNHVCGVN